MNNENHGISTFWNAFVLNWFEIWVFQAKNKDFSTSTTTTTVAAVEVKRNAIKKISYEKWLKSTTKDIWIVKREKQH